MDAATAAEAIEFVLFPPLDAYAHGFNSSQGVLMTGGFFYHGLRFSK